MDCEAMLNGLPAPVRALPAVLLLAVLGQLSACDLTNPRSGGVTPSLQGDCAIPESQIREGCEGKDCIRSLDQPELVDPAKVTYLRDSSRVVGLEVGGQAVGVALDVLRWHEIVNVSIGDQKLAVTYCPLTGSAIAFDRSAVDGREFGVSGLLFKNNLIMYDRTADETEESLWTQMHMQGDCGGELGTQLPVVDVKTMQWKRWNELNPSGLVVSDDEGSSGQYRQNEYAFYERKNNDRVPFSLPGGMDERRPPKERVLGIPVGENHGTAYPFGELETASAGGRAVVADAINGEDVVVFWDQEGRSAEPYFAELDGRILEFTVRDGRIVDEETGSRWNHAGRATSGSLAGSRLEPVRRAYVAFWFAWAAFQPETSLWRADR